MAVHDAPNIKGAQGNRKMATKHKRVWLRVKRYDLNGGCEEPKSMLKDVRFPENCESGLVHEAIKDTCGINSQCAILKLRNHRGSLIPISCGIQPNSKTVPYILEVVREHQFVQSSPRTVEMPKYTEALKKTLDSFVDRLDKLEGALPELRERRHKKLEAEMVELDRKLAFLNQRFNAAENSGWKGMFNRHPLW